MFQTVIKWLSITVTVSLFALMVASSVYQVINSHEAQIVLGILAGTVCVVYLVFNGVYELAKLLLPQCDKTGITYGPGIEKRFKDNGMVIKDGKLESYRSRK